MELHTIIITGFFTIIGIIIGRWYDELRIKRRVDKAELTGTWLSTIYIKRSNESRAVDFVSCKHNKKTNYVSGNIFRLVPGPKGNEDEKQWEFLGRFSNGVIYIMYWCIKGKASSGVIIMNFDEEYHYKPIKKLF